MSGWAKLYGTERWRRRSKRQLQRVPCCERCESQGRTQEATLSHHSREYLPSDGALEFFTIPLISLCENCHREVHGKGPLKGFDVTIGVDGYPIDFLHPANQTLSYEEREQRKKAGK
jgi:hypothetical protein